MCKKLFSRRIIKKINCEVGKKIVLFDGTIQASHKFNSELKFDSHEFAEYLLNERFFSTRDLYWKLWGYSKYLKCKVCG